MKNNKQKSTATYEVGKYFKEIHPEWHHPVQNMNVLILGTFPPHQNKRKYEFYYPNPSNHFWQVLAAIANYEIAEYEKEPAVAERKKLMETLNVGIQNIGKVILRKDKSAADEDIKHEEFQDLLKIFNESKSLSVILLTGYTGKSSTYYSFLRYLDEKKISHTLPEKVKAGYTFTVTCDRTIKCVVCNSTSKAARRIKFETLVDQFSAEIKKP